MALLSDDDVFGAPSSGGLMSDDDVFGAGSAKPKKNSALRGIADLGLGFTGGAVGATKALADAAGAGNGVSEVLDSANKGISGYLSDSAKADQQQQAAITKEAEGKGTLEGIKAGFKAFGVAPAQTMITGFGSVVPVVAGAAATALTGGGAPAALAAGAGIGATMGAGTVKGAIFDEVKKRGIDSGMGEADAVSAATKAQEYGGDNTGNIALGAGLGVADAATGVTAAASKMLRNAIVKPVSTEAAKAAKRGVVGRTGAGMAGEMPLEAAQGGQERYAANVAAQRAGYEADPWAGVASQATLEALASAGPGAIFGAVSGTKRGDALPADSAAAKDLNQSLGGDVAATPTLVTDIDPMHADLINRIIGVGSGPMDDKQRAQYEKDLAYALDPASPSETVGYTTDANGIEIPFTMRDYVASTLRVADMTRDQPKAVRANSIATDRLAELGNEETTQQPDITPGYVPPAIPVVGPLSAIANAAVQSGAHQTAVMQQAAAAQAKVKPVGAQKVATAPAQGPMTEVAGQAPNVATPAPNPATPANAAPAAVAEIQQRQGNVYPNLPTPNGELQPTAEQSSAVANEQQAGAGLPAPTAGGSRSAPAANQEPVKNQSEQPLDMVPAVDAVSQPKNDTAPEAKQDKAPVSTLQPDPALQNLDRGRAASVNQMQSIARNPDYMRLGPSRTPDSGAPMVFAVGNDTQKISPANFGASDTAVMSDGQRVPFRYAVVDANQVQPSNFADGATNPEFTSTNQGTIKALNNGRTAGVRSAHSSGNAATYTTELLADNAHGVSPEAIRNTPNPMLVRVYAEQSNTGDMAAKSQGQGLGMSASERATQDAELMTADVLDKFAPGDIASAGNRDFVRAFVGKLAENELADMMDATGNLSQDGRRRIEAALLTAAYGKSDLVQELFESTDTDIKAIGNALKVMSGQWAAMRQAAKEGSIDLATDMTANLIEAVNIVRRSRAEGSSIAELAGQGDLMGGNYLNELSELFLRIFYKGKNYDRARGGDKVIAALQEIVTSAMNTKAEAGLFGDSFKATPKQIVESARSKIDEENKPASQSSLFGANGQATAVSQGNRSESAQKHGEVGSRPVSPGRGEETGKQAEPVDKAAEQEPKPNAKEAPSKYGIYQLADGSFAKFDRVWYRGEKTERAAMLSEMVIPGNSAPKDRLDSQSWVFAKGFSRNDFDGSPLRLTKNGEDAAVDAKKQEEAKPVADDEQSRDSYSVKRFNGETQQIETESFARGEYVRIAPVDAGAKGKESFGEIVGISHANEEAKIGGVWYSFGQIYKAKKPEVPSVKNVSMDSVIDSVNKKFGADITEADRVPSQYNTMADIDSAITSIYDGTVSVKDYKAAFNGLMANKDAITAELGKMTIPQLHERFGKQPYGRPEKKGEIIERAFEAVRNTFSLRRDYGRDSYSMGRGEYERYLADNLKALTDLVNASTDEDLKTFADEIGQTRAARQEKVEAAQDPKTVEDFDNALRLKKAEGMTFAEARMSLTPEQRAEYDRLKGIATRDQRKARADQQKADVRVASQTTDGQVVETKHTKTGEPLFVVKAAERVERDVYTSWNTTAKRMGGHYSAFRGNGAVPGFQFKTRENADAFLAFIGGNAEAAKEVVQERRDSFADDRSQSAVERLNEMADKLEDRADESLGRERKANTERRARFAASAESAANAEKAMAKTMRRIASAISDGTAQFLDRVRQKAQIEYLTATLRTAKDSEARAESPNDWYTKELHKKPVTAATADYAEFPQYSMMRSDLANLARKMISLPNMKMLGQRILKVADDTSTVYNAFAKEHLLEVSKFGKADGSGWANFSTLKDAERSIEVSKLEAVAVPLQIKRGEYRIVLSPSEAINRGIWKGDDRKIFLSPDVGEEIVEKLGKLNRGRNLNRGVAAAPEAPWQFENAYNNRKRLAWLGIEQPWEFRAALREFAGLKESPKEVDKIKQMERAMIGRKNDGLDFFPTPAETAQAMIEAAEITEGMSVLEPSAGMGHIAEQIRDVAGIDPDVIEFNGERRELLEAKGFNVIGSDFMDISPRGFTFGDVFRAPDGTMGVMRGGGGLGSNRVGLQPLDASGKPDARRSQWVDRDSLEEVEKRGLESGYDRIIMNPPFSNRRDAEHVQHAYSLLRPGGRLVAIMGEGVFFGQDKKAVAFREWLDEVGGTSEKLEEGTFLDPSLPVNTATNARMVVVEKPEGAAAPIDNEGAGNVAAKGSISPADKAIYGMAAEGNSAAEVLKFIASASRSPFNRQVARLLLKTGIAPTVTVGDSKGWKMNAGEGHKYAAAFNPDTNTVALFRPAASERNVIHEFVHAATLKALSKKGLSSMQMKALFAHVEKNGKSAGLFYDQKTKRGIYGMANIDEFIAESFSNPKFQAMLKQVSAAPVGGKPSSAWDWFIRVVRGILGLKQGQDNALSQALEIGIGVMRENMKAGEAVGATRYAEGQKQTDTPKLTVDVPNEEWLSDNIAYAKSKKRNQWGVPYMGKTTAYFKGGKPAVSVDLLATLKGERGEQGEVRQDDLDWLTQEIKANGFENTGVPYIEVGYDGVPWVSEGNHRIMAAKNLGMKSIPIEIRYFDGGERVVSGILHPSKIDGSNPDIRYNVADEGWSVSEPSKLDDVIYAMQDKQVDMKRVMQSIMKTGKQIKDGLNPYLQEELFHGRASKGVKDFLDFELRPLLKEMQQGNIDMGDFEEYLWNAHAQERNEQIAKVNPEMKDGGSGIKTADAKAYLAALSPELRGKYQALAARVNAINKASQKALVDSGLEKQETIDAWNGAYQHYVPLQREDVDSGHIGTGKGFSIRGSSTKRALGSGRKVVDIIANLTMQRERNIVRAEKNRVTLAVRGLAMDNPNADFWTVDEAPKERVIENKAIYTVMDSEGRANEFTRMADAEKFARSVPGANIDQTWQDRVTERVVPGFSSRDNVLLARVNGEDKYVIFNERDARALRMVTSLKNLDMDNMGRVLSLVGKATRYLSAINTQYNPVFGVINLIRDTQGALVNLSSTPLAGDQKRVLGYTTGALIGIYKDIRAHRQGKVPSSNWAALFEEFQKEGGQTGYRDQYANAEARAESIISELKQIKEGKPKQMLRGVFGWLSDYNDTMENAVRLAAYKVAKEKGMSKQQAASLAKNLTVNFNRKGQVATQVGALYAFFNASMQGSARLAQTLFEANDGDIKSVRLSKTGKKILAGGLMLGSMQALLLAAAGFGDDEPPDFIRERNLILPIGDGKYLTLAMPLGLHVIPGIGRIATEFVLGGGKDPLKHMAAFAGMFAESFNPIGSAGFSLQTIAPSVIDPFAALAENRDFTGKEIYRENRNPMSPTPGHARAKDVATVWSRYISEGINFMTGGTEFKPGLFSPSPDSIDYLLGQLTGGVGREANKIGQTARAGLSGEDLPLYKIPLVGRFVGDTEGQSGQSAKFYDAIKQINMHEAEYKGLIKDGRRQEASEYMAENPGVRLIMAGNHAERTVQKLRSAKRDLIEKDADKDQIRAIDERITTTMRSFNERAVAAI